MLNYTLRVTDKISFISGGSTPNIADFVIAARLMWAKVVFGGETSEEWGRIRDLDGGRWGKFLSWFKAYETIV